MSLVMRKPVFGVCDHVRLKPACSAQKLGRGFKISDIETRYIIYPGSEQKRCLSNCTDVQADLRLCCLHTAKQIFSWRGSYCMSESELTAVTGYKVFYTCLRGVINVWFHSSSADLNARKTKFHWTVCTFSADGPTHYFRTFVNISDIE